MKIENENSLIADRIFKIFDLNHDSVLNFREFVLGISVLTTNNLEAQIDITFCIFDIKKTGLIEVDNFIDIIKSCLTKMPTIRIPEEIL